ncbi:serine/threonine-protein kinase [Persicimonas caeni]|nr:protein kinase [Persicimonas caeni]
MKPQEVIDSVTLGPFDVHERLAQGAMGVVFAGEHRRQQVPVAIKVINRPDELDARLRRGFRREVQAAAGLNHPGIVMIFDYGEVDPHDSAAGAAELSAGTPYYVMELTRRGTLRELVGQVRWTQLEAILLTLLDALAHAHAAGVIHRDLKPDNILLGTWGSRLIPKLADFGLSRAFDGDASSSRLVGSPRYMAPEQIDRPWHTHGPWSDLYALGCVAFELISGRSLFDGMNVRVLYQKKSGVCPRRLEETMDVPAGFQAWLDRMLAPAPADRFATAADAARALARLDLSTFDASADAQGLPAKTRGVASLTPVLEPILQTDELQQTGELLSTDKTASPPAGLPDRWPTSASTPRSMRFVGAGLGLYGLRSVPIVGRERELQRLWDELCAVTRSGKTSTLVLRGNQGCGKTRLVQEFTRRLEELGVAEVLRAAFGVENGPGEGLGDMLARHLRIVETDAQATYSAVQQALGPEVDPALPDWEVIAHLARSDLKGARTQQQAPVADPNQYYAAMRRYLRRLASKRPVVVWLDDAQWGIDGLEFVRFAQQAHPDDLGPVLFVVVATDDLLAEQPDASQMLDEVCGGPRTSTLAVEPLGQREHTRLVRKLLLLDDALVHEVVERTAGNPLFAVELVGEWIERGVLEVAEQGFVLADGVVPTMPDHLHEVCVHKVDAVLESCGPDARHALELAAALGAKVDRREWHAVCEQAKLQVDRSLVHEFVARRFARHTDAGWEFCHALVRQSIERASREAGRWQHCRRRCADMLERLYEDFSPRQSGRFGLYAMGAGEYERAVEPLWQGARAHRHLGEYSAANQLAARLMDCFEAMGLPDDDVRWGKLDVFRARLSLNERRVTQACAWAVRARDAAKRHGWTGIKAQALAYLGLASQWMGESDASALLLDGYALIRDGADCGGAGGAMTALAQGLSRVNEAQKVNWLLDRELEMIGPDDPQWIRSSNFYMRARLAFFQKDFQDGLAHCQRALTLAARHPRSEAQILELLSELYRRLGELERAEAMYEECLRFQEATGSPAGITHLNLALLKFERGGYEESEAHFLISAEMFEARGRAFFEIIARAGVLACAAARGWWGVVGEYIEPLATFLDRTDAADEDLANLLERTADALRNGSQCEHAVEVYALAAEQWRRLGDCERAEASSAKRQQVSDAVSA